jgi:hypothetical protein
VDPNEKVFDINLEEKSRSLHSDSQSDMVLEEAPVQPAGFGEFLSNL